MKGVIVEMDMYYKIRSYYNDGKSIRWIARTLGISRQTVKKYCSGDTIPGIRKEYHRDNTIVTDDVEQFILDCFKEDEAEGLKKQQHTAKRIYDRLVDVIPDAIDRVAEIFKPKKTEEDADVKITVESAEFAEGAE